MSASAFGGAWSASRRRGSEAELHSWLELAIDACDEADRVAMAGFRHELTINRKPDRTFVTQVDREIEELVRARVLAAHPDHGVIGEELGAAAEGASVRWYVDPIDGTHNYLRGVPIFATLLAVEREGEIQVAVVSAPALASRWFAARGTGSWSSGPGDVRPRRLQVSAVPSIEDGQLLYGDGPAIEASGVAPGFRPLLGKAWRTRGFGDFWGYMLVAEGSAEAMVEEGLAPWDVAAPLLLIEEAGGRLTGLDGSRSLTARDYLASNGLLHQPLLEALLEPVPDGDGD
jgi:histidinol-phosphatase